MAGDSKMLPGEARQWDAQPHSPAAAIRLRRLGLVEWISLYLLHRRRSSAPVCALRSKAAAIRSASFSIAGMVPTHVASSSRAGWFGASSLRLAATSSKSTSTFMKSTKAASERGREGTQAFARDVACKEQVNNNDRRIAHSPRFGPRTEY